MCEIRLEKIRQDMLMLSAKYTDLRSDSQLIATIWAIKRDLNLFLRRASRVVLTSGPGIYRTRK